MDRLTRHDLKTDKFVEEVGHTVEAIEQHRGQLIKYGGAALAVLVLAGAGWYYQKSQKDARQLAFFEATETFNAFVGPGAPPGAAKSFPTPEAKEQAIQKDFGNVLAKYSGTNEGAMAAYMLGAHAADQGKLPEAEKFMKSAADEGDKEYASLAKLSLAEIYNAQGKKADAEKVLRDLVASPTTLVTKDQATLALARVIASTKPDEARKLLEPLRTAQGSTSRYAIAAMGELGLVK